VPERHIAHMAECHWTYDERPRNVARHGDGVAALTRRLCAGRSSNGQEAFSDALRQPS